MTRLRTSRRRGIADVLRVPLRQLHRWPVGAARERGVLREPDPGDRPDVLRGRPVRPRPTSRRRSTPPTPPRPAGARPSPAERAAILNKIADRIEENLESIALAEVVGQRQADPRDAQRRHPAGRRPLPLLRRAHPRAGGLAVADRRRHRRLPLPRAARRGRADHPVELPDPDGRLEAGARAGRGQRRSCSSPPSRPRRRSCT